MDPPFAHPYIDKIILQRGRGAIPSEAIEQLGETHTEVQEMLERDQSQEVDAPTGARESGVAKVMENARCQQIRRQCEKTRVLTR